MSKQHKYKISNYMRWSVFVLSALILHSCVPKQMVREETTSLPETYNDFVERDSVNVARMRWQDFFADHNLQTLIDTALVNNQELNITLQRVAMANNEIKARTGEYLPTIGIRAGAEVEKVGRYTSQGANDATTNIKPGEEFPEPLNNIRVEAFASWEVDVWKKLRNSKKTAVMEYLSSVEGKNFMITNLISEVAEAYYELLALDNKLAIIQQNLGLQNNAVKTVKLQKQAARATELGVRRLEAEVLKNQSEMYAVKQEITETENRINFLIGRTPQHVERNSEEFIEQKIDTIYSGVPAQLLQNRPDIKQAEYELAAAKLDVKVAKANFFPSLSIEAGMGLEAFKTKYLTTTPESLLYSVAGNLVAPVINRNAIRAEFSNANARQLQAVYDYEKTILNAYIEVVNQLSNIDNLKKSYQLKEDQVGALTESIEITNKLFRSARADYMEVLLTQREALESKMELVETKKEQLLARVSMYRDLGGGWVETD